MLEDEFSEVVTIVSPELLRCAWLLTGDHHASEDLLQQTLLDLYLTTRRRASPHPRALARRILMRRFVDARRLRRNSEIPTVDTSLMRDGQAPVPSDLDATVAVRAALAQLKRTDQAIVVMRYYLDLSVRETADSVNLSESVVRARSKRALGRLRAELDATPESVKKES